MLLRLGGIPCRYVTGFVPSEHNDYNGTWIARNKDAHAWVEAYVEPKGWTTIEATPESGIPQQHETSSLVARIWEAVTSYLRDVTFRTRRLGFLYLLKSVLSNRLLVLCLAILVAWSGTRIARDWRAKRTIDSESPHQKELRRLLKLLDKVAARHQFVRRASETIGQFADRIDRAPDLSASERPMAQVYRQYAAIRFDRQWTEEKLAELCTSVKTRRGRRIRASRDPVFPPPGDSHDGSCALRRYRSTHPSHEDATPFETGSVSLSGGSNWLREANRQGGVENAKQSCGAATRSPVPAKPASANSAERLRRRTVGV